MVNPLVETYTEWAVNFSFWASVAFFIGIGVVWPWWKSFWGVNIVSLEGALMLAMFPFALSYEFGIRIRDSPVFAWIEATALWLVGIIVVWRGYMIISQQVRGATGMGLLTWLQRRHRSSEGPPDD